MKVLVVLVLVVFTGCIASPVVAKRQKTKLDIAFNLLVDLLSANIKAADSIYRNFRRTEFGKAVIECLKENANTAVRTVDEVADNLPDSTKEIIEKYIKTTKAILRRMFFDVPEYIVKNHLEPMAESAAPVIEEAVGALVLNSQPIQDAASPYINELMVILDSSLQDFQARLQALHQSLSKTE